MTDIEGKGRSYLAPDRLDDPRLLGLILRLGLPAVAGLSINAVHHTINLYFVGMLDGGSVAAVTAVIPILMMCAAVGEGLGVGCAAVIGNALGARDLKRAHATASATALAAVVAGLGMAVAVMFWRAELIRAFGVSDAVAPLGEAYLAIAALSVPLTLLQILADFIAISEGNTRFSMLTLLCCFLLNIVLDPLLMFTFGFGLEGAAIATILSQLVTLAVYALYFHRRTGTVELSRQNARLRADVLKPVFSIGIPVMVTSMLGSASFALLFWAAGRYQGDDGVAAAGIAMRMLVLGMLPVIGLSLGGQPVLSFAWGGGDRERMRAATSILLVLASAYCLAYGVAVFALRDTVAAFFTEDEAIRSLATEAIAATHVPFIFFGLRQILVVLLQAQGRARLAAFVSVAQNGYFLLPLLMLLPFLFGFDGVLAALAAAPLLTAVLSACILYSVWRGLRSELAVQETAASHP
jgi:putative MATE family efflux protein